MNKKIHGEYIRKDVSIPSHEYVQALYFIRGEESLKRRKEELLNASRVPADGQPKGKGVTSDSTAAIAMRLSEIDCKLEIINSSLEIIPEEFREPVKFWVQHKGRTGYDIIKKYNLNYSKSALSRHRVAYVQEVAKRAKITT